MSFRFRRSLFGTASFDALMGTHAASRAQMVLPEISVSAPSPIQSGASTDTAMACKALRYMFQDIRFHAQFVICHGPLFHHQKSALPSHEMLSFCSF